MCCFILVWEHYWPRYGRNNVLIGLPDLTKERKLSKNCDKSKITEYLIFPICFCQRETFHNLINSKLIYELVSSDKTVFLYIKATQV